MIYLLLTPDKQAKSLLPYLVGRGGEIVVLNFRVPLFHRGPRWWVVRRPVDIFSESLRIRVLHLTDRGQMISPSLGDFAHLENLEKF